MSKKNFQRINSIDFKNEAQLKGYEDMAKLLPEDFAKNKLANKSKPYQEGYLHSTILELQAAGKNPEESHTVKALEGYMLKNGHTKEDIQTIKRDAIGVELGNADEIGKKATLKRYPKPSEKTTKDTFVTKNVNEGIEARFASIQPSPNDKGQRDQSKIGPSAITQGIAAERPLRADIKHKRAEPEQIVRVINEPPEMEIAQIQQPAAPQSPAQDSFTFGPNPAERKPAEELDPITETIRKEILLKQQKMLQGEMVNRAESEGEKRKLQALKISEFREYVAKEGKDKAKAVLNDKEFQEKLNVVETLGYKKVHEHFKDNFKNVEWKNSSPTIRTVQLSNNTGTKVGEISETTHTQKPQNIKLSDGSTKTVNSYRTINFPKKLEGEGPLHLSMAVKDENGQNISEKDAIYFTAHYDKSGKLTEVSSPMPVKFTGTGPDAVGYIERAGKIYTLPVTRDKYNEMMQEVSINKGTNVNLSQSPEENITPPTQKKQAQETGPKLPTGKDVGITLVTNETPEQTTKRIDNALKGKTDKEVVDILKKEVEKGKDAVVEKIVQAIDPARQNKPADIPTLNQGQYKEIYMHGMKTTAPNEKDQFKQLNIHKASGKLLEKAAISTQFHVNKIKENSQTRNRTNQPGK